ncbi:MAG TPA: hypothetical protein VF624_02860 [Tepidisphaeraceae bacterium]|jgi:hypothetical protein
MRYHALFFMLSFVTSTNCFGASDGFIRTIRLENGEILEISQVILDDQNATTRPASTMPEVSGTIPKYEYRIDLLSPEGKRRRVSIHRTLNVPGRREWEEIIFYDAINLPDSKLAIVYSHGSWHGSSSSVFLQVISVDNVFNEPRAKFFRITEGSDVNGPFVQSAELLVSQDGLFLEVYLIGHGTIDNKTERGRFKVADFKVVDLIAEEESRGQR